MLERALELLVPIIGDHVKLLAALTQLKQKETASTSSSNMNIQIDRDDKQDKVLDQGGAHKSPAP